MSLALQVHAHVQRRLKSLENTDAATGYARQNFSEQTIQYVIIIDQVRKRAVAPRGGGVPRGGRDGDVRLPHDVRAGRL